LQTEYLSAGDTWYGETNYECNLGTDCVGLIDKDCPIKANDGILIKGK